MKEHAKKALKHDTKVLGKTVPTMLIIGLFLVGGGSAAILSSFGTVSGQADVTQAIQIDNSVDDGSLTEGTADLSFGFNSGDAVVAGTATVDTFTVKNSMDRSYSPEFVSYPGETTVPNSGDSVTDAQFVWSDAGDYTGGIRTTYANYFSDAGATHDSSTYSHTSAAVTVDPNDGNNPDTIQAGIDAASSGDTVVVKDGDYSSEWISVDKDVTVVADNLQGAEAGRFTVKSSDVTIKGFEVVGDGANYNGISVEPKNGADTGVVIEDNYIHGITDYDTSMSGKKEAFGVLVWGSDSAGTIKDLTIRNNVIENIGKDSNDAQGIGIALEDIDGSTAGVTVENNNISSIRSATIDGYHYPGVGIAVLPELTNPNFEAVDDSSKIASVDANAHVSQNVLETSVDLSLAGDTAKFSSHSNRFLGEINVLTEGNVPDKGTYGITELDSSPSDEITGTADLKNNFFEQGTWSETERSNIQDNQDTSASFETVDSIPSNSEVEVAAVNEFALMLDGSSSYSLATAIQ